MTLRESVKIEIDALSDEDYLNTIRGGFTMKKPLFCAALLLTLAPLAAQSGGSGAALLNVGEYLQSLGGFGVIIV
jgi:hypothetical protein